MFFQFQSSRRVQQQHWNENRFTVTKVLLAIAPVDGSGDNHMKIPETDVCVYASEKWDEVVT
jgi:hypothetical protein